MKRTFLAFLLLLLPFAPVGWTGMTCANNNKTAYQTIGATEAAVLAANGAYLDSVVIGVAPTNNVPKVEAAFNDTQLALRTAAALASGGLSAPVPATVLAKATAFTNTINAASVKTP